MVKAWTPGNVCIASSRKKPLRPLRISPPTNAETASVIQSNMHLSPLYSGKIEGIGPRYCPSIEDKFVKFPVE